jgi:ATPase subunit of ABC transporter with duplicated ATPase domains
MTITVENVSKGFAGRMLFKQVTCAFSPGRRYGLTGPNGSGKTTFMRILIGDEDSDEGMVRIPKRTGWLRQDQGAFDTHNVLNTVMMGNARLWAAMAEKEVLYAKEDFTDEDGMRLGELEGVVAEEDGYTAEVDATLLLAGLGVEAELHDRPMSELQGGMKVKVLLAQALFGTPEALLLDEPTNHLDMDSIVWLEDFLCRFDGVLVVISHDRRFLNAVCNQIADIDYEAIITYTGTYDDMVRAKAQVRGRMEKDKSTREKKISQLQDFVSRFGAGTRASQTRSRQKQIQKLRPDEIKRSNIARPFIRFTVGELPSGRDVLSVDNLSHSYDEHKVFEGFHSTVARGDKVAILGRNGVGKTTLVNALLNQDNEASGAVRWGHNTRIGVFGHNHRDQIDKGTTVYQWLFSQRPEVGEQNVRAILGRMLFSGTDGSKPTTTLSGGEAARLVLCKLILMEYNVLVLDEPTDHLDLESISALKDSIDQFNGTLFYVTHDRDLASVGTRIWCYPNPGELVDYSGTLDEYLDWYNTFAKAS